MLQAIVTYLRATLALGCFMLGCYLILDLLLSGFSVWVLMVAVLAFIATHFLWPKGEELNSDVLEVIGDLIDLPYRLIALILRGVVNIGKSSDDIAP